MRECLGVDVILGASKFFPARDKRNEIERVKVIASKIARFFLPRIYKMGKLPLADTGNVSARDKFGKTRHVK